MMMYKGLVTKWKRMSIAIIGLGVVLGIIESLVSFIDERLYDFGEIIEKDRWTIWNATKPR